MKTETIHISRGKAEDIPALVSLLKQLFAIEADFTFDCKKHETGLKLMMDGCGKHRTVRVAQIKNAEGNKIVGMCTAQTRISTASGKITAVLEDLIVDEGHRNMGIGTALLKAMECWSKKIGIEQLSLLADKSNRPALSFYSTHNWKQTRMICLTKKLTAS